MNGVFPQLRGLGLKDLLTLCNLACGLVAIVLAARGELWLSFVLVLFAVAFDFLDGKAARGSRAGSNDFGRELDSLADVVSFGAAPAVMAVVSSGVGALGVLAGVFYCAMTAVRLARFNLQEDKKFFVGLPSPAAGVLVAFAAAVAGGTVALAEGVAVVVALAAGLAMVAGFKLRKF